MWSEQPSKSTAGRAATYNICTGRQGFTLGLHPQTEREAFLVFFDTVLDICVRYTNLE
jgi:hypothetical protein